MCEDIQIRSDTSRSFRLRKIAHVLARALLVLDEHKAWRFRRYLVTSSHSKYQLPLMSASTQSHDAEMRLDESLRDDSSARKYNKTAHINKRPMQQDAPTFASVTEQRQQQQQHDVAYDSVAEYRRARALTADNLERIPDADQLAPGIRLPGQFSDSRNQDTDMHTSSDADGGAQSLETGHTSVGAFGEGGAPVPGVPPELDPRTSSFRPQSPGEASVFSVAVQPPASPKESILETSEQNPYIETSASRKETYNVPTGSASATAGSTYSASARGSSPPLSVGYGASESFSNVPRLGPGPSLLGRTVASVAPSEAGSVSSSGTGGGGPNSTLDDQEVELRAAYIERQRMREREMMGGEAGVGGSTLPSFMHAARGSTPLAFAPSLSTRMGSSSTFDDVSRAGSTAATVGTSSPPLSLSGSEIPDAVASPSRRGSADSTGTLGSVRAPPSVQGYEAMSGIESRRMSRAGSSIGFSADVSDNATGGGRLAMDEDEPRHTNDTESMP